MNVGFMKMFVLRTITEFELCYESRGVWGDFRFGFTGKCGC